MRNGGKALVVEGLSVEFGGVHAVEGLDFEVQPGSVHGLVGANGSGKTTTLNAISGFVAASGRVELEGVNLLGRMPSARSGFGVARTFQSPRVPSGVPVRRYLQIGMHSRRDLSWLTTTLAPIRAHRQDRAMTQRCLEVMGALGLAEELMDEPTDGLPAGTVKLLDVARALMADPTLLLLDEPTSGLSNAESDKLCELIAQRQEAGTTVLVVEHNIALVRAVCTQVTVMNLGQKLCDGPPETVFEREDVVAAYLGEAKTIR